MVRFGKTAWRAIVCIPMCFVKRDCSAELDMTVILKCSDPELLADPTVTVHASEI